MLFSPYIFIVYSFYIVEDVKRSVKVTLKLIPKEEFHNVSIIVSVGRLCVGAEVDYSQGEPPKILWITGDEILQVKMKLCDKTFRNQHSFLRIWAYTSYIM